MQHSISEQRSNALGIDWQVSIRRFGLFLAMLISGGLLIFPRGPLLLLLLGCMFFISSPIKLARLRFAGIWILLVAVGAIALFSETDLELDAVVIRYANFIGGLALMGAYLESKQNALSEDIQFIGRLMAIQAVLTPILALVIPGNFSTLLIADNAYTTLGLVFNYHDLLEFNTGLKRPDGFFYEPGVFQIYLNIFVFITLFIGRFNWLDLALGVVAVIATQSTTGAVILLFICTAALAVRMRVAVGSEKLAVLVLVPILLLPIATYAALNLNEKLFGDYRGSSWAREYDLWTGLAVIRESPLTGIGFDYDRYYEIAADKGYLQTELSDQNIANRGNSNGLITLLYSVGIPLGIIFIFGLFRQTVFERRYIFAAMIAIALSSEALIFTPFFLFIIFSGLLIKEK